MYCISSEGTKARPQLMCTENFVKFGHVVLERCEWTDRHRDRLIALLCTPTRDKVKMLRDWTQFIVLFMYVVFYFVYFFNVNLSVACKYSYSLLFSLLPSHLVCNQATGYASQHIWCLSQARINWEDCGRKGIWHKNGGMMEVGHWLVRIEWRPAGLSVCLPLIFPLAL